MSWMSGDLRKIALAVDEEFQTDVIITGALTKPNERAKIDPERPRTCIPGIFHEPRVEVGGGRKRDGLKEVDILSTDPTVSILPERLCWAVKQGDLIEIPELGRKFRVKDIGREMHLRQVLTLEDLNRIPAR